MAASKPFDPNTAQNHIDIEKQFAVKAVEQAQTYWNLIEKVPPTELKLTKIDDEIYEDTLKTFPELAENDYAGLIQLDEEWMKSPSGKERWREFIERYKKKVKDYNFGSLIRMNAKEEYVEKNTIFGGLLAFALSLLLTCPGSYSDTGRLPLVFECLVLITAHLQFYAFEIARNRLGLNDTAHDLAKAEAAKEKAQKEKEAAAAEKKKRK
ncbi:DUF757-domain-containing protein [Mycena indigotica]|uniref:DUF757-domain-containing protein n=1 Tax=Mycena indigotica TaxID=2126181 RepID=A0A8H6S584_9AGAR|nr:DUF757-domain-containing protein [Mycena indigotica]KAF7293061.1 DUF757-domain-containing protein [Mycena indigotica]